MKNVETLLRTHKKFKRRYTRSAHGAGGNQRGTHTHSFFFSSSFSSALCSLINKKKYAPHNVKCYKNPKKEKSIYFYCRMQQHEHKVSYRYKRHTAVGSPLYCIVYASQRFCFALLLIFSFSFSSRLSLMPLHRSQKV